ncbi:ClpP/crotonase [Gonapodya prolifera JEL478]|uniref:3-hydroxyisobutyryl-CoA hydrolase n=1 Tax=Gonapodya prolifera (strain JEL478) TaxID=1344416 RepID=A0A139ANU0_GONPJ|nr:ClpP/crotonase [Gonapodya prolifera JEL478]|eukprot:KXS18406.1 ClpP/crotonase [Gonapodya prolifera JEL478]
MQASRRSSCVIFGSIARARATALASASSAAPVRIASDSNPFSFSASPPGRRKLGTSKTARVPKRSSTISASVQSASLPSIREMSSAPTTPGPQSVGPTEPEVVRKHLNNARLLVLNRPKALNALSTSMCLDMAAALEGWDKLENISSIILTHSPEVRAFCAGGDIKNVAIDAEKGDFQSALSFFDEEYKLDHMIATLDTPFVSIMDGITMGGGVGLSVHAPIRIATERTLFAMPETAIGFFPDVGGAFFLSRLDGELGAYLGLTGRRLKGEEVLLAGIATHYIPHARIPALIERLSQLPTKNLLAVQQAVEEFVAEPPSKEKWNSWALAGANREVIDRCFGGKEDAEDVIKALEKEESPFAKETLDYLTKMSPTAMKVTLQQIRRGKVMDVANVFKMEFRLCQEFVDLKNNSPDLHEGVSAVLIRKDNTPNWKPPLESMSTIKLPYIRRTYFATVEDMKSREKTYNDVVLKNDRTYFEYPHRFVTAFPKEEDVENVVKGYVKGLGDLAPTKTEVVDWWVLMLSFVSRGVIHSDDGW